MYRLLRGFARTSYEITKQRTIRMLFRTCRLRTKLWDAIWVLKSTFWSRSWIFSQKIWAKSVTNTVKDFTKTFWLWKRGTKGSGCQVCWQTIAGHRRGTYLKPITGESHKPLHFIGTFLPVSSVCKVTFCTNTALCIFESLKIYYIVLCWCPYIFSCVVIYKL